MPAELTNDGTAMLVMRNFGYLGIHSSIHPHSKLACDRLVDFTGDMQVRRRRDTDINENFDDDDGRIYSIDVWHKDFIGEPTVDGGRSQERTKDSGLEQCNSPLFAQELTQIPLLTSHGKSTIHSSNVHFHTSFCNELILGPRIIRNCSKRNITIKIEIRRLLFSEDLNSFLAILPESPMIHNNRRGPFLVNQSYTPCAYHKVDPQFMDNFKVKLPLNLMSHNRSLHNDDGKLVAIFSVYNISVKGRKKWTLMTSKGDEDERSCPLELLGCGYLPLSTNDNTPCLITDGLHNVKLKYMTKVISTIKKDIEPEQENESANCSIFSENDIHSPTTMILENIESLSKLDESKKDEEELKGKLHESMVLQVRSIAFSSLHVQNPTLSKFFQSTPPAPRCQLHDENKFDEVLIESDVNLFQQEEEDLMQHTMNVAKSAMCPPYELVTHFLRINFQLWRTLVCGVGEPSLLWANPRTMTALRLHSFSSLLHILNAISLCLAKVGVTELNGRGKWNTAMMSRVVLMLFDEESFFSGPNEQLELEKEKLCQSPSGNIQEPIIDDVGIFHDSFCSEKEIMKDEEITNDILQKASFPPIEPNLELSNGPAQSSSQDDINIFELEDKPAPLRARSSSAPNAKFLKIDTKTDFQTALNSTISPTSGSPFGNASSGPAANRRKWMTAPSSSLATIQEDNDKIDERHESSISENPNESGEQGDALDTELFKTKANKVKQFRVPKLQQQSSGKIPSCDSYESNTVETESIATEKNTDTDSSEKVVPKTDKEIADAGTAFLDMVGKNFGYE
jgi:hypothetical protein